MAQWTQKQHHQMEGGGRFPEDIKVTADSRVVLLAPGPLMLHDWGLSVAWLCLQPQEQPTFTQEAHVGLSHRPRTCLVDP